MAAPSPTFVFIGPTGAGKSSLINSMLNLEGQAALQVGCGANSVTSSTMVVQGEINGHPCRVVDTPGLSDSGNRDTEHIVEMVRVLKNEVKQVNTFVIVLNGEHPKLDQAHKEMIAIFGKCFGSHFMQNMVVVFSRWYEDTRSQRRRQRHIEESAQGFQGTPEQFRTAEFEREFQAAFSYTGIFRTIFIDSQPAHDETGELQATAWALKQLSIFGRTMDPFHCQNIQAVKTFVDQARGELEEVRLANESLAAENEEQKRLHSQEIQAIQQRLDQQGADHKKEMDSLRTKLSDAEAAAAKKDGGDGNMMRLVAAMMMLSMQQRRQGGGGGAPMPMPIMMGGGGPSLMGPPGPSAPIPMLNGGGPRCKDDSLDMRFAVNRGKPKYG